MSFPMLLLLLLLITVLGVGPSLAAPPPPLITCSLSHQDSITTVILNQLELDKTIRASSASCDAEVKQLRQDTEKTWQAINNTVLQNVTVMTVMTELTVLSDRLHNETKHFNVTTSKAAKQVNDKLHHISNRVVEVNSRVEDLTSRVEGMNNKTEDMHSRVGGMNNKVEDTNNKVEDMNRRVEGMNNKVEDMNNKVVEMNATINDMKNDINELADRTERRMSELSEELNNNINVANENIEKWIKQLNDKQNSDTDMILKKLQDVHSISSTHYEQTDLRERNTRHNDTSRSLCEGNKVLYGGYGELAVTHSGNYAPNLQCTWEVYLPVGSRPVFQWTLFSIEECVSCRCDYVQIYDAYFSSGSKYCGSTPPDTRSLTITNNRFKVHFHSDYGADYRGFRLKYRAIPL